MTLWAWWWMAAFALLVVELMTGTFYVLMIALGVAAGGAAAWAGGDFTVQLGVSAVVATVAVVALRRSRWGGRLGSADIAADPKQTLDIGQRVHVTEWQDGRARVSYRGSQWDAQLAEGEPPTVGTFYIREVRGTRLVVSAHAGSAPVSSSNQL